MDRYRFRVWWNCRVRPFFAACQLVEFAAESETDAEIMVLGMKPDGPFLHRNCGNCGSEDHGCCYVAVHERVYPDNAFSFSLQLPPDWFE